jgi:hypothetical protein
VHQSKADCLNHGDGNDDPFACRRHREGRRRHGFVSAMISEVASVVTAEGCIASPELRALI